MLAGGLAGVAIGAAEQQRPVFPESAFNFGRVTRGTVVEHAFVLRNEGTETLRLRNVTMSPALALTQAPARVNPGTEAPLLFRLDTSSLRGAFEGVIIVSFGDASLPDAELTFSGVVVSPIEASPTAFFVVVDRGQTQEQSLDIRSHETDPLYIEKVEFSSERAAVAVETLEEGRRYRLKLTAHGDGVAGKRTEVIRLATTSKRMPVLRIPVHTYVRERVYTFPEAIDMGAIPISAIRKTPHLLKQTAQTLMVYRKGTSGFVAKASSDVPALVLDSQRGPAEDRWQFTLTLNEAHITPGPIQGSVLIETNDPEFPRLRVPVAGRILDQ